VVTKLLAYISPFTKYLYLAGLVGAFVCGLGLAKMYYTGEIAKDERAQLAQTTRYLERVMELDAAYAEKIKDINKRLVVTQEILNEELAKEQYACPIPADGIRLLNDALNANKPSDSRK
jgi:hypothetical protein